jgi:hypothetical protein
MKKFLSISLLILLSCSSTVNQHSYYTYETSGIVNSLVYSAEDFFISIQESVFETSWDLLSEKSKNKIINEIYEASRDNGTKVEKDDIRRSFRQNGIIASNFWNAAKTRFDPAMVLEESQWEVGFIKNDKAEIIITYKKSSRPSKLKMYNESGSWRVGLVETFWPRRYMESLFSFLRL